MRTTLAFASTVFTAADLGASTYAGTTEAGTAARQTLDRGGTGALTVRGVFTSLIIVNRLMRLADFISANVEPILQEWEASARSIWAL